MEPKRLNGGKTDTRQVKILVIMGLFERQQIAYKIKLILCSGNTHNPFQDYVLA